MLRRVWKRAARTGQRRTQKRLWGMCNTMDTHVCTVHIKCSWSARPVVPKNGPIQGSNINGPTAHRPAELCCADRRSGKGGQFTSEPKGRTNPVSMVLDGNHHKPRHLITFFGTGVCMFCRTCAANPSATNGFFSKCVNSVLFTSQLLGPAVLTVWVKIPSGKKYKRPLPG